ncbi:MAG: hypothetical protein JSR29_15230 [Nitrospira sp.]|nr:hypothetical protein [Nitrospira sp.]
MDHFESIMCTLLEADGYWVRRSFKVNVTKEEKCHVGKHSIPRPEIDLLALHFSKNEVLAFEAKSFLDSPGVKLAQLQEEHEVPEGALQAVHFAALSFSRFVQVAARPHCLRHGESRDKDFTGSCNWKDLQRAKRPNP